ncbi:MAG: chemotaxis protein CheW, partial [Lentisphaerae bacterium GWF2_52_8]
KYLTFRLADEVYGLPILKVQEIISLMPITRVPRTPAFVMGVINLRGKVIPVISMRSKFSLAATPDTERTCIIVVQIEFSSQTITLGIIVDEVSEVLDLKSEQISPTPAVGAAVDTAFLTGMGKVNDEVVMLLNLDLAFSAEEISTINV